VYFVTKSFLSAFLLAAAGKQYYYGWPVALLYYCARLAYL